MSTARYGLDIYIPMVDVNDVFKPLRTPAERYITKWKFDSNECRLYAAVNDPLFTALLARKETRYPLDRKLRGPLFRSGSYEEESSVVLFLRLSSHCSVHCMYRCY